MRLHFYSPVHFEQWDWRNLETGIGGSETHHIEMVWRLARRGHEVISYAPLPANVAPGTTDRGVTWYPLDAADFNAPGIWVLYRCPDHVDFFKKRHAKQQIWLVMQDESYPTWTPDRCAKVDKVLAFCRAHYETTAHRQPLLTDKLVLTSNGMRMDLVRQIEAEGLPARNPHKLIYASSPDRGLKGLLKIFARAREAVPDLELHCFYGFDNIDKLIACDARQYRWLADAKASIQTGLGQPGVHWRGRVSQRDLYREWLTAGIWCYPTNFTETSCITCMEAQALGAVPITHPLWALADNVMTGVFIEGDAYHDWLTQARYAGEIVRMGCAPELQDQLRPQLMRMARDRFNWERVVDQWEGWLGDFAAPTRVSQYCFQHKHARGRIANVGCDGDFSDFHARGAVNVDLLSESPILRAPTKADMIADARDLPFREEFDTVVLGDILEHMQPGDAARALRSAAAALRPGGRVVLTVPNDHRPVDVQHVNGTRTENYAPDISCYHTRPIGQDEVEAWARAAGLEVLVAQPIDYTLFEGCGVVASKADG